MEQTKSLKGGTTSSGEDKFYKAWEEDRAKATASRAEKLRRKLNLGERFRRRTFESFDQSRDPNAYESCLAFTENYKDAERNSLLIIGSYGTGKTHLAAAITNKLADEGIPVLFDTFNGHLNKLKAGFNGGDSSYLNQMQSIEMLVIDDAGKEKQTEWSRSIMFDVINYRYEHLLPFVMTSNLNRSDLEAYLGGAVWSRMCEMCTGIMMSGKDYRKGMGMAE